MTSSVKSSLAAFALACAVIGFGLSGAQPATTPPAARFDHDQHAKDVAKLKKKVDCQDCHGLNKEGKIAQPGAQGHYPCMQSGCHADLFLGSAKTKPDAFKQKQTAVCTVCHTDTPVPWKKAPTKVLKIFESQIAHHVEMNHYQHTQMKLPKRLGGKQVECRTCHVVNAKGVDSRVGMEYGLAYNAPGHNECVLCHNPQDEKELTIPHTMGNCGGCHQAGSRASYFGAPRGTRGSDKVTSCESEGLKLLRKAIEVGDVKLKKPFGDVKARCFAHETKAHRFKDHKSADPKQPVQCNACHGIVEEEEKGQPLFKTLKDMKEKSIIDRNEQKQHAKCGSSGCHAPLDSCGFCHADVSGF
jgi:hypothetical protein